MKPRQEKRSCFALLRWGLKHLQLSLLLLAIGMLVATSYASGRAYSMGAVSYTHLRAHETVLDLV